MKKNPGVSCHVAPQDDDNSSSEQWRREEQDGQEIREEGGRDRKTGCVSQGWKERRKTIHNGSERTLGAKGRPRASLSS